jgi:translation elongation factor EF-G
LSASIELATGDAFKPVFAAGQPQLLEPMMRVLVTTPRDCLGAIIGDLQIRRGNARKWNSDSIARRFAMQPGRLISRRCNLIRPGTLQFSPRQIDRLS